ncbi:hypothetical protein PHMEG_00020794 [Phytophthora megakarya]|uniref:GAG-pre-integrase domain-containing protein n=1 Tax=Phytophthora megakarya TaxID=4795 RepID=A0A225VQS3_9STRA|nr:hypothetical protein PHMEG_00020794 [Phytophthora megakarya]
MDFFDGTPEKPEISVEVSQEEAKARRWRYQHWTRARSGLLNLFNQALPNVFLSALPDQVSKTNPCDIWKELEHKFGLGDAKGVIMLRRQWERLTTSALKEWHLRLGHVGKGRLMNILAGRVIKDVPHLSRRDMENVSFFCRTRELGKSRRMSYKNIEGQKATDPLHTLHMDLLEKIRPQGLYTSIGHKKVLAVVDDATAYI